MHSLSGPLFLFLAKAQRRKERQTSDTVPGRSLGKAADQGAAVVVRGAGEAGLCRFVPLGLTRLLATRTIMDHHALSARAAWTTIETLLEDERLEFLVEPEGIDAIVPRLLPYSMPAGKLLG
jgi:hypothetical protein